MEKHAYRSYLMYLFVAFALVALGSWVSMMGWITLRLPSFLTLILSLVLMIMFYWAEGKAKVGCFYLFCFGEGLLLSPMVSYYLAVSPTLILQTLIATLLVTVGSGYVGLKAKNLTGLQMGLLVALIAYLILLLLSFVLPLPFLTQIGVALFTLYIAVDLNRFKLHVHQTNAQLSQEQILNHVMSQFLNILNLFQHLLRLLANRD